MCLTYFEETIQCVCVFFWPLSQFIPDKKKSSSMLMNLSYFPCFSMRHKCKLMCSNINTRLCMTNFSADIFAVNRRIEGAVGPLRLHNTSIVLLCKRYQTITTDMPTHAFAYSCVSIIQNSIPIPVLSLFPLRLWNSCVCEWPHFPIPTRQETFDQTSVGFWLKGRKNCRL